MQPELSILREAKPGKAVVAAGITNISYCNENPLESYSVNVSGTKVLVRQLAELGWEILLLSTAEVFSHQKQPITMETQPNPKSNYGLHKRELEIFMDSLNGNCGVVRITKVIGPNTQPFAKWIQDFGALQPVWVTDDRRIAPLSLSRASRELSDILLHDPQGLWHLGGGLSLSYPQIARHLAASMGPGAEVLEKSPKSERPEWVVFDQDSNSAKCRIVSESLEDILADLLKSVRRHKSRLPGFW
jgi:dTDP-4-dehydrorhamnose reductase